MLFFWEVKIKYNTEEKIQSYIYNLELSQINCKRLTVFPHISPLVAL